MIEVSIQGPPDILQKECLSMSVASLKTSSTFSFTAQNMIVNKLPVGFFQFHVYLPPDQI
ncbi:hypothetical protein J15TS10_40070 [Paenibacillus woosongensis]|uniref:Uncharacterized protein n=1 Tax=Paenibacillus woosongensis TaxID=307580 RepID=A0ABQ4MW85_9BACL|nr:hypothetical protein J15TS10_40070 [Paenibacillus woosongensis]